MATSGQFSSYRSGLSPTGRAAQLPPGRSCAQQVANSAAAGAELSSTVRSSAAPERSWESSDVEEQRLRKNLGRIELGSWSEG
jgi:hypothetical protein